MEENIPNLKSIPVKDAWELEYQNQQLLSPDDVATVDSRNFIRWYFKEYQYAVESPKILDLGCGLGKTLRYAELNYNIGQSKGFDISFNAVAVANKLSENLKNISFFQADLMENVFWTSLNNSKWDIVILGTVFHLFNKEEKIKLIENITKVLNPKSVIYLRTFISDGDKNVKNLFKLAPGPEENSYLHPGLYVYEFVDDKKKTEIMFSANGFKTIYSNIDFSYQKWQGQSYKRKSLILYLEYDPKT